MTLLWSELEARVAFPWRCCASWMREQIAHRVVCSSQLHLFRVESRRNFIMQWLTCTKRPQLLSRNIVIAVLRNSLARKPALLCKNLFSIFTARATLLDKRINITLRFLSIIKIMKKNWAHQQFIVYTRAHMHMQNPISDYFRLTEWYRQDNLVLLFLKFLLWKKWFGSIFL